MHRFVRAYANRIARSDRRAKLRLFVLVSQAAIVLRALRAYSAPGRIRRTCRRSISYGSRRLARSFNPSGRTFALVEQISLGFMLQNQGALRTHEHLVSIFECVRLYRRERRAPPARVFKRGVNVIV